MSYDLFFRFREGGPRCSRRKVLSHFLNRPHYEMTDEVELLYFNESTGVCFRFYVWENWGAPDPVILRVPKKPPRSMFVHQNWGKPLRDFLISWDPLKVPVSFEINYFRPHFYALEADQELQAFVNHFNLLVMDHREVTSEYSSEDFLDMVGEGDLFCLGLASAPGVQTFTERFPTRVLDSIWRWNYTLASRQEANAETLIPPISFFKLDGTLRSGIVWKNAVPILLPAVDVVVAPRLPLEPEREANGNGDIVIVPLDELDPILSRYPQVEDSLPARRLAYPLPPQDLVELFRNRPGIDHELVCISFNGVMGQEFMECLGYKYD